MTDQPPTELAKGDKGDKGDKGNQGNRGRPGPEASGESDSELLEELRKVGSSMGFRIRTRRVLRVIAVIAVVALIGAVGAIYGFFRIGSVQEEACIRDNQLRKAYVDQWTPILAESPAPSPPPAGSPPEVVAAYEAQINTREIFTKGLANDFAQHSC